MLRPKIIDRYILREVMGPLGLGLLVVTFALVIARLLKLIDLVVNHGFSVAEVATLLAYIVPSFLELTFPMAILLGTLLGFGRLSSDEELTAARSCGISLYRLAVPAMLLALVAYLFSSWLAFTVRPWANARMRYELYSVIKERATVGLQEKIFNHNFPGLVVYVDKVRPPGTKLEGIMIADERTPGEESTIVAHNGYVISDEQHETVTLRLVDGAVYGVENSKNTAHVTNFKIYDLAFKPGESLSVLKHEPEDMDYAELRRAIAAGRASGKPNFIVETELARKYTIPVATLLFALLGISLGLKPARGGQSERFGVSVALFALYYGLMRTGQSIAEAGRINSMLAMSIPDLVFAAVAIYYFHLSATDRVNQNRGPGDFFWNLVEIFERRRQNA